MKVLIACLIMVSSAIASAAPIVISEGGDPFGQSHLVQDRPGYYWGYNFLFSDSQAPGALAWTDAVFNMVDASGSTSFGNMYVFDTPYSGTAANLSNQDFLTVGSATNQGWSFGTFNFLVGQNYYLYGDTFYEAPLIGALVSTNSALGLNYAFDTQRYTDAGVTFPGLDDNFFAEPVNLLHSFAAEPVFKVDLYEPNTMSFIILGGLFMFWLSIQRMSNQSSKEQAAK